MAAGFPPVIPCRIERLTMPNTRIHLHLVSDSTGDTVRSVARATLAQFEKAEVTEHFWSLVRSEAQVEKVIEGVAANPGLVFLTQ